MPRLGVHQYLLHCIVCNIRRAIIRIMIIDMCCGCYEVHGVNEVNEVYERPTTLSPRQCHSGHSFPITDLHHKRRTRFWKVWMGMTGVIPRFWVRGRVGLINAVIDLSDDVDIWHLAIWIMEEFEMREWKSCELGAVIELL